MYKTIEELVTRVDERNNDGIVSELIGVSIDKCFIKSVANTNGTDLSKYKIIRKNDFAVSLMQVSRDGKIPVARLEEYEEAIMSPAYPEYYGAAEPPVRCGESHLSGLTEPPHFFIKLLCHCWVQSIYFSHREVFRWVNTFNIDLIGIIRYTIHDGIGKSTFTITDLLVPLTFTELRTKDC
jgi:hypothetical protein